MKLFKTLVPILAIAGLGGCAVYPSQGYDNTYYGSPMVGSPYVVEQPVYIGGPVYRAYPVNPNYGGYYNGYPRPYPYYPPRGYNERRGYDGDDRPVVRPGPPRASPDPRPVPPSAGLGQSPPQSAGPRPAPPLPPQNAGPRPAPPQNIQPQPRPGVRQDSDGDGEPDRPMRR